MPIECRRRRLTTIVSAAAVTTVMAPAAASGSSAPTADAVLSNEWTLTRWAYPTQRATVRSAPMPTAPAIGRLRFLTEGGFPEVYLLLERRVVAGQPWVRIRVPQRPAGRTGWVPRPAVGSYRRVNTAVLINRSTLRLTVYRAGRRVLRVPVGVGKRTTPTPAGRFWIREKFKVSASPIYGPRALGTSAYATLTDWPKGGVVGLHGTNRPSLIPGRPSHGCVRLRNGDIARLYQLVPRGTPVRIV